MILVCAFVLSGPLSPIAAKNVEAFRKATVARDFGWFERTLAPDYVQVLGTTKIDRKTALASLRKGLAKSPLATLSARLVRAKPIPGGYIATGAFSGTMRGVSNGRPIVIRATWRDDQTWVSKKGAWTLRATRTYGFERTLENP